MKPGLKNHIMPLDCNLEQLIAVMYQNPASIDVIHEDSETGDATETVREEVIVTGLINANPKAEALVRKYIKCCYLTHLLY
jgi:hypothetical protein